MSDTAAIAAPVPQPVTSKESDDSDLVSNPEARESVVLLATLSVLASRLEPEITAISKALCSQLDPTDQRAARIGADVLVASGLLTLSLKSQPGPLFSQVAKDVVSIPIQRQIFDDAETQIALWEAVDPDFTAMLTPEWGPERVADLLSRLGIRYTLESSYMTLDTRSVMTRLVWGYRWVPEAAEYIYKTLFSAETQQIILEALEDQRFDFDDDESIDFYTLDPTSVYYGFDHEMVKGLKLLAMSISLFLGASFVLGHTMVS